MFRSVPRSVTAWGACVWLAVSGPAFAQFYPGVGGSPIDCPPTCAPPVAMQCVQPVAMQCVQPVAELVPVPQTCYQNVAVTEYRPTKVTVQRPVVETKWVEEPVTAYRPITEARTAEVPTVNYVPVTECQTVTRDMGRWVTERQPLYRPSPCEYDPRPGFAGWWNRTAYNVRSSFTPPYRTTRRYVPNVVAQAVPVTRMVAQHGTRQVTYNVTRMEAYQTTRKVAVNSVKMVAEEVTRMEPVTVMKTVPTGTTVAWVSPSTATAMAAAAKNNTLAATPDPLSSRSADGGGLTTVPSRTADSRNNPTGDQYRRSNSGESFAPGASGKPFDKDPAPFPQGTSLPLDNSVQPTSLEVPAVPEPPSFAPTPQAGTESHNSFRPTSPAERPQFSNQIPSIVRAGAWTQSQRPSGPVLTSR